MATAKKTPSGMWRIRCLSHTDAQKKKHYVSFTAPTKAQAEQQAAAFNSKKKRVRLNNISCLDAVDRYIEALPSGTSPSTIRGYNAIRKRIQADPIGCIRIKSLTDDDLQDFVHRIARERSAKTVRSTYSLLMSAINKHTDAVFRVKLPKVHNTPKDSPTDAQVSALIAAAPPELRKAILLAAFGTLRRGEAAALKYKDLNYKKSTITVHADRVLSPAGEWIYKSWPKTDASFRTVELPPEVFADLGKGDPEDYVVDLTPGSISDTFKNLRKRVDISIRFHDLRHYSASVMAALGISDVYAQRRGGWSSSGVLKSVYQNVMSDQDRAFTQQLNAHFASLLKKDDAKDDSCS